MTSSHDEKVDTMLAERGRRLAGQRADLARFREIVRNTAHGTPAERTFLIATLGDASRRRGIHLSDEDRLLIAVFNIFIRPVVDEALERKSV